MRKSVIVLRRFSTLLLIVSACLATIPMLISQCAPGIIEGTVFLDKDLSGVKDATENGESGVFIRIYDKNGILISQSISSSNGKYSIPGLIDGQNYRVQFEIPSTYYLSSTDPDIGSDVQFVTSPACNVDLGILDNNSNCSGSSEIILTCFANTLAPNYDGQETLIGLVHDFDGSSAVKVYATQNETGPIWGLGFNDNNQMIYSSAFVKQHTQLTPHGHDAIFITDVSNNPNTQLFAKLSDLGQEVGELDYTDPNDCNYGKQVGTIGLGALSFNDTKDYLFIANLYNNTIVKINIDNPQPSTTAAFTVPDPGCSFGDYRIFAVEHHNSALYVGVTCTGETSLDTEDLSFHVYKFDFETEAFGLEFSTDYTKGVWNIETTGLKNNQQWLTDIDFTDDGNMVLGVSDRFGHSYCNGTTSRVDDQKGDILLVENYNGTWVLENNGETSKLRGTGVGNGEGPGGGEFFGDDYFILDREDHPDVALGSIFVMPGTNEVVSTVFDPERNTYSGGLHRYSTVNGAKVGSKELYSNNVNNYFGKATGFGNVISRCGKLLPEVGNLVWNDVDCDGTQSAGEEGIAGITVNMYDRNCNLVGTTVTNASGRYSFNKDNVDKDGDGNFDGMVVDDIYYIAIDPAQYVQPNQSYNINDVYYSLTNYSGVEQINSNAVAQSTTCSTNDLSLIPTVKFVASAGINASLDIGLKASTEFDLALTKKLVSTQDVKENDLLTFEIKVYNQGGIVASEYEIVDYLTAAFTFNQADNPGWTIDGKNVKKVITENLTPTQNRTETLKLRLKTTADISNYVNYAEISYAKDQFGNISSDIDSNPDDVKNNDKGGYPEDITDNLYTDDGTIDEDDHDPAKVYVLDLALRNILQDVRTYDVGEFATFEMTIINQGNVAVTEFDVVNQFPTVMTFESSANPGWTQSSAAQVVYTHSETLEVGERKKISINLRINDSYNYDDILNLAEISRIVSANPAVTRDVDSTPNAFLLDDNGGNPYDNSDNMVGDDGSFDEDDHDPAILSVRLIDLALLKTNQKDVYNPGDLVEFQITVFNQGQTSVGELMVVDYLPEYTTLADNTWAVDDTDPTGSTVYKNLNFIAGFNPGDSHTEFITLKVDEDVTSGYVINMAEIAAVYDRNGVDVSGHDVDSEPDRLRFNDNGGVFSTITDNEIRDDGTMDEDDHDPSGFYIASASFTNSCHCLSNASNIFNGQFLDSLTVTAPPGQTWYIDEVNNLYHVSSPAPPGAVVPFTTGPGGYILTEFPLTPDLSEYLLEGIFEDGKQFNIRVTNGSGVYLQASSAGYDCTYNRETIVSATDGLSAVCSGSLHSYGVVSNNSCNDFEWSLSAGGTIMGPIDQETVSVRWDIAAGGPYELTYSPLCPDMCLAPIVTEIIVGDASSSMSCHGEINVSLNNYCSSQMYANVFLTSQTLPNEAYQLMMVDSHGKVVHNNLLTREHLWKTLTAKVTDPCTGNSCWSKVRVEDKSAPSIQCNDISVPCNLMESYEPLMLENCHEDATIRLIGETITPLTCDPTHIKEVKRTYVSEDGYGNISEPCEQTIRLERIPLDEIEYPEHFILNMGTNLTCIDSIYDENGNVKTEITGVPKLNGHPIYPVEDFYCNVGIDYSDFVVAEFGCVQKIMRTWRVYESWCTTGVLATPYVQTIEIADTKPPVVTCPDPIIVTSSGTDCSAEVILQLPTITDDCSTTFIIDLSYDGGFNRNVKTAQQVTIESGVSQAKYFVYDQCENIDSCSINIEVLDQSNPVAVCDENTIVSLRSTGTAKAFAHTFDDGSYDDCSLFKTLVRRMDSQCDCVRPEFEDMNFLGERDGSYYYLSSFKTHGTKAFDYSSAYGGNLVVLDSEEECNWLHTQAIKYISSPYYIGLSDKGHPGQFTWEDHTEPDFNKFIGGSPADVGDNVVTNLYGDWVVVDGFDVEAYYILEVNDPCGFSDEVYFCCEDAAEIQQVVFRVVDYFGRTNECMVNVEVQDKVAPKITCPPSQDVSCERDINIEDLSEFGTATATDQCGSEISDSIIDTRNECMFGDIIRRFYASDNNGFSSCDQVLTIINTLGTTENVITWPLDFDTDLGCTQGDLHPDSLAVEFGRPRYDISNCNQLAVSYDEQRFAFAGPGSDACLKILRRWTVIDWCQMDDPDYEPETYDQVIKVNNVVGPTIQTGCDTLNIFTEECLSENVSFSATAEDDCTLPEDLKARIQIDTFSDGMGVFDIEVKMTAGQINFNGQLPIGQHFALISFTDQCNNTTTCAKIINVNNITIPTAACIDGISIAVEPMDLDGNGTPDTERACVFPEMVDASSTHVCDTPINLSFSQDTTHDKLIFDCNDLGIQTIELWVTDIFGNTALCETTVEVQDNNNEDFCPRFDLALIKTLDTIATPGPFEPGDAVTFNINVINQGNIGAFDIGLVDYVPDGLTLNDGNWTQNGDLATLNDNIVFLEDSTNVDVKISFTIDSDFMGFSLTNTAEISQADNDNDPNNPPMEDSDSTPDMINDDVVGGDNSVNSENGDEDDHDVAIIEVEQTFDLALEKDCSTGGPYMPGSTVTYILTVTNQGTVNAPNVELEDNIPSGLILNDSDWTQNGSVATLNTPIPLVAVGTSVDVEITFTIDDMFMNQSIVNTAQIIDPNNLLLEDVDSTPGNDDGDQSEDDEASKMIVVGQVFDLALLKQINFVATPGPFNTGDDVAFTVTVYNQGSIDATNVQVIDYVPEGFTFDPSLNTDFNIAGSNASAIVNVDSDEFVELDLVLSIDDDFGGNALINSAEIISANNALGLDDQDDDLANTNPNGVNPELLSDDDINDERPGTPGSMDNPNDEDDYDPAVVDVNCTLLPVCQSLDMLDVFLDDTPNGGGTVTIDPASLDDGSFAACINENVTLSIVSGGSTFDCTDLGSGNIVTLQATDTNGNVSTNDCQTDITVIDNTPPTLTCTDVTVSVNNAGQPILVESDIVTSSDDNCFVADTTIDLTGINLDSLICTPMTAVITVNDQSNNDSANCEFLITIENSAPEAFCNTPLTFSLDANGEFTLLESQVDNGSTDDCSEGALLFDLDINMFDCDDVDEVNVVVLTVTDEAGLTDTCSSTIVIEDNINPVANCQDRTVELNANGNGLVTANQVNDGSTDECGVFMVSLDNMSFDCDDIVAVQTVVLTVTDNNGNTDTCEASITVEDNEDPTVTCEAPFDVILDDMGMATVTVDEYIVSSDDNCGIVSMTASQTMFDCSDVDLSPITISVIVQDASMNADTCMTTVNIIDNQNPSCTLAPLTGDVAALSTITLEELGYSGSDNCATTAELEVNATIDPIMFGCNFVGMTRTVTVTVTDGSGNTSTCEASVDIIDVTTPECISQDITVSLDETGNASITPEDVDNGSTSGCDDMPMLTVIPSMFDCMDAGTDVTVTLTISTSNGESDSCDALVTVEDNMPPELSCAIDTMFSVGDDLFVLSPMDIVYSSTDNCDIMSLTADMAMFTCDDIDQVTTVTVTATDVNGNSTTCQTDVTVVDDIDPECTLMGGTFPPDVEITLAQILDSSDDNCDDNLDFSIDQNIFDCTELGVNTITVTVTDDSGNTGTCFVDVTIEDIPEPVCNSFSDITVFLDAIGEITILPSDVDSMSFAGCAGIANLEVTPDFFACNDVGGFNTTTLTVTDGNGLTATCTTNVTVLDTISPVISCPTDVTIELDADGNVDLDAMLDLNISATDGCDIESILLDINSVDCSDKPGPVVITATATDENGNTDTCAVNVTVEDNMAPTCTLLENLVLPPNVIITPATVLDQFTDNCATASSLTTVVPNEFDCTQLGVQTITVTVTDDCDNTGTCDVEITIEDNSMPICVSQDITVSLNSSGIVMIDAEDVDGGSSAACGSSVTLSVTPDIFSCDDIGDNIVELTVTASGGDSDSCTATVTVVDDIPPTIVCPADMTLPCDSDISNLDAFGDPTVSDNCDMNIDVVETNIIDVNGCNVGTVLRTFTATDDEGNTSSCMQTITIDAGANPIVEADITWPTSPFVLTGCIPDANNIDSGMPIVDTSNAECFDITISFEDFGNTGNNCNNTFTRTWTVVDSCQTNGTFTFNQIIDIDDQIGPDVSGPADMVIILPGGVCDTFLNLPATVTDCTSGFTAVNDSPHADSNATADASGTYPVGFTSINVTATDACGNDSIYNYTVSIIDTTVFFVDCAKIIDNIESNMMVTIPISAAMPTVDGSCGTSATYDFSFSATDPTVDIIIADCSFVGFQDYTIYLFVGTTLVDSCTNLLQIVDPSGFCTAPIAGTVTGDVFTPDNRMVDEVSVALVGSPFEDQMTDTEGKYAFPEMPFGGTYMVEPRKDIDYLNGVSTLDLIEIQKHVLGIRQLDSPYKLIAADVNRSGDVTTADLLELRRLILGVYDELPNNTSWRMIDSEYKFVDAQDPFTYELPEYYEIFNFEEAMKVDFVGVKIGDVNNSVVANALDKSLEPRSGNVFKYDVVEAKHKAGTIINLKFSSEQLNSIKGIQHTLSINSEFGELISFEPITDGLSMKNVNKDLFGFGLLNLSWHKSADWSSEDTNEMFELSVRIKKNVYTSDLVQVSQKGIKPEAYYGSNIANVDIDFRSIDEIEGVISLYQNVPNPWNESTEIKFYMPSDDKVVLNVYDVNGKRIYQQKTDAKIGVNKIRLNEVEFKTTGILYYELISGSTRLMNKMLLIK